VIFLFTNCSGGAKFRNMKKDSKDLEKNRIRPEEKLSVNEFRVPRSVEAERLGKLNLQIKRISHPVAQSHYDKSGN
jgi:hypothetical protein